MKPTACISSGADSCGKTYPRCITSVEQELPQVFTLTEESTRTYRCLYCETKAEN